MKRLQSVIKGSALRTLHIPDGLYQVTTPYLCAGFVVEGGRVTMCAPILHKRLNYWMTIAVRLNIQETPYSEVPNG